MTEGKGIYLECEGERLLHLLLKGFFNMGEVARQARPCCDCVSPRFARSIGDIPCPRAWRGDAWKRMRDLPVVKRIAEYGNRKFKSMGFLM